jgi:hypothetical protein
MQSERWEETLPDPLVIGISISKAKLWWWDEPADWMIWQWGAKKGGI